MLPGGEARIRTGGKGFAGLCLTTWPLRQKGPLETVRKCNGADNGARTRDPNLGKVVLYQLSHVRICKTKRAPERPDVAWRRSPDSNRG